MDATVTTTPTAPAIEPGTPVRVLAGEPYRTQYLVGKVGTLDRTEVVAGETRYWVRFPARPPAPIGDEYWFVAAELEPTNLIVTAQVLLAAAGIPVWISPTADPAWRPGTDVARVGRDGDLLELYNVPWSGAPETTGAYAPIPPAWVAALAPTFIPAAATRPLRVPCVWLITG